MDIVARVIIDVLSGLHAAHTAKTLGGQPLNIVHRDVSPQNIMIGVDGIARVLDFGIAKAEHRRHQTRPGRIKGKYAYMSPEQIRGQPVDARTDVFAAGVVLWECLAKRRLFRVDGQEPTVDGVLTLPILPPSHFDAAISPELDAVVLRALSRDRNARFASAAQFAESLRLVMTPASPVDVGRWVTQAAKRSIANRSDLLQDLETSTINAARSDVPARYERKFSATAETLDRPNANQPTVVLDAPAPFVDRRGLDGWSLFALFLAAAGAVSLLGMTLIAATVKREPLAPNLSPAEARSTAQAASTHATLGEEKSPPPAPEPPQAFESLPELSAPSPAEPHATTIDLPSPEPPALKPAPAAPKRSPTAEVPAPKPAETTPAARSCDPPYRIDQHGIRRVRRECL
jgi:serine/threonine-protein kinase